VPSPVISRRGSVSSTSSRASEPLVEDDADDDDATTNGTNDGSMILPPKVSRGECKVYSANACIDTRRIN
jgi:hypothetical protein